MIYKTKSGALIDSDDVYIIKFFDDENSVTFFDIYGVNHEMQNVSKRDVFNLISFCNSQGANFATTDFAWSVNCDLVFSIEPKDNKMMFRFKHNPKKEVSCSTFYPEILDRFYKSRFQDPASQSEFEAECAQEKEAQELGRRVAKLSAKNPSP